MESPLLSREEDEDSLRFSTAIIKKNSSIPVIPFGMLPGTGMMSIVQLIPQLVDPRKKEKKKKKQSFSVSDMCVYVNVNVNVKANEKKERGQAETQ